MALTMTRTHLPSTVVFADADNEQFFTARTRTGMMFPSHAITLVGSIYGAVAALDRRARQDAPPPGARHAVKLRSVLVDDQCGSCEMAVDYLHDIQAKPRFTVDDIQRALGHGEVRHQGQGQWVEVTIRTADFTSDDFASVSDDFYRDQSNGESATQS